MADFGENPQSPGPSGWYEVDTLTPVLYATQSLLTTTSMRNSPHVFQKNAPTAIAIATLTTGIQLWTVAQAQNPPIGLGPSFGSNFASRLADAIPVAGFTGSPLSGSGLVLGPEQELTQGLKGGFLYGAGLSTTYDSNFSLSENDPESELITSLSGVVTYFSDPEGGAPVSIVANYSPNAQFFLENPDNDGIDQSGGAKMTFTGGKTVASAYANVSQNSGTDPLIGEFVSETLVSAGVEGSYQVAPRTSVSGSIAAATSDYGLNTVEGSNMYSSFLTGSWAATEYFSFGPEIQFSRSTSDNAGTRDSWQFLMQGQYQVGERIQVSGSIGLDYATDSRDDGSASTGLAGNFNANYSINEKLSWSGSVLYVTVPAPDEVDYVIDNLTISTSLSRKLLRATVDAGVALNVASYEAVGPTATSLDDDNNLNLFVTYSRSIFLDRVSLVGSAFYSVNDGQSDWNQFQLSLALNAQF